MKKYEILEHPAELRIRVLGKTKEELFKNAAEAMADILATSDKRQKTRAKEEIKIESADLNTLLVDFLNEILAKSQINKCAYEIEDLRLKIEDQKYVGLEAGATGHPVARFDEDIKAVTYQDVNIEFKTNLWQTIIVFDI